MTTIECPGCKLEIPVPTTIECGPSEPNGPLTATLRLDSSFITAHFAEVHDL